MNSHANELGYFPLKKGATELLFKHRVCFEAQTRGLPVFISNCLQVRQNGANLQVKDLIQELVMTTGSIIFSSLECKLVSSPSPLLRRQVYMRAHIRAAFTSS